MNSNIKKGNSVNFLFLMQITGPEVMVIKIPVILDSL